MPDGFQAPIRRLRFDHPPEAGPTDSWLRLRQVLCSWTVKGCAYVEQSGRPLEVTALAAVGSAASLGGATLVVMHDHLDAALPPAPMWAAE